MKMFFWLFLTAILAGNAPILHGEPGGEKPNVLLISIDSLRADHLGCYGYGKNTTPHLDELARSGVVFENAVSTTSWTLPAHMSLLTSQDINIHGVVHDGLSLHPDITSLTQVLKNNGYATACFCTSPYMNPAFGFARGFDLYHNTDFEKPGFQDTVLPPAEERDAVHEDITGPRITELALDWLQNNRTRPLFLFLHMWDVHYDYIPPPPYDRLFDPDYRGTINGKDFIHNEQVNRDMNRRDLEHIIALYDGEIASTDYHLGLIFRRLEELGLLNRTLIVITADHGDEFFEHGGKGHRNTLYDEVIRVPLLIRAPGGNSPAKRISGQVSIIDIAPTILDYVGIVPGQQMQGSSLLPSIREGKLKQERPALLELGYILKALRTRADKLLFNAEHLQTIILDLVRDPKETGDYLITDLLEWTRINRAFYDRLRSDRDLAVQYRRGEPGPPVSLSREQVERLKTLGYGQ